MSRGLRVYSMEGEDLLLNRVFDGKVDGFYVDIGAFHPVFASNTYFFYRRGWRGINIDPTPGTAALFQRKRPRDVTLELAVGAQDEELDFYIFNQRDLNTLDPSMKSKFEKDGVRLDATAKVRAKPLRDILSEHLPASVGIDFFNIDTEGYEEPVLRSNDWQRFRPKVLCVEFLWLSLEEIQRHVVTEFLTECGYELFAKCHYSVLYRERGFRLP